MIQQFCGITGLINFICCLFFTVFVYLKNKKNQEINRTFALWQLSVAFWSFGYFIFFFTSEYHTALFWVRFLHFNCVLIPATFLHFAFAYLNLHGVAKNRMALIAANTFSSAFAAVSYTPLFIPGSEPRFWFRWWPIPGPLYHAYIVYFAVSVLYAHYLFFKAALHAKGVERKQLMLVSIGTAIAFSGGSTNFFLFYNIPVPPVFNFLVVVYVALIAYAVLNYKLWQIEVVIRKTVVFTGLMAFGFAVFAFVTVFIRKVVSAYVPIGDFSTHFLSIVLIILFYDRFRDFLIDATDRFLFQKKFDYQQLLKDASKGIALIQSLDHLARLIAAFITIRARIRSVALFVASDDGSQLELRAARGFNPPLDRGYTLSRDHPLAAKVRTSHHPLRMSEVLAAADSTSAETEEIRRESALLHAEIIIPSFLSRSTAEDGSKNESRLRSLLVLGAKKSDAGYTEEDLNVFYTLAQEAAIAIENARLYDAQIKKTRELARANEELASANKKLNDATTALIRALADTEKAKRELESTQVQMLEMKRRELVARMSAALGHEIQNPLQGINFTYYHFNKLDRLLDEAVAYGRATGDAKIVELAGKISSIVKENIAQPLRNHADRIKGIANSVTDLIKGQDRFSDIHLGLVIHYAIEEIRFTTYWERLAEPAIEINVPRNLPLVYANAHRLQGVFVNMIKNAYDAMGNSSEKRITIRAEEDSEREDLIKVCVEDTGCGMDEETAQQAFDFKFTTKGKKGTGIGLAYCKDSIEAHGGVIRVETAPGRGARFVFTLRKGKLYGEKRRVA